MGKLQAATPQFSLEGQRPRCPHVRIPGNEDVAPPGCDEFQATGMADILSFDFTFDFSPPSTSTFDFNF
jgi:hypothetical protein